MIRYIIRRLLWGVALLIIVCALTFVLFRVLPTANPAVLRAGRDPQPKLIKEIEAVLGLNKPLHGAVLGLPEGSLPALQLRLQLLQPGGRAQR